MRILGTLTKITPYRQLIVEISKQTYDFLCSSCSSAIWEYTADDSLEQKYYCKISLDKYEKQLLQKRYEPLVKQPVIITASIKSFTPEPSDEYPSDGQGPSPPKLRRYIQLEKIGKRVVPVAVQSKSDAHPEQQMKAGNGSETVSDAQIAASEQ